MKNGVICYGLLMAALLWGSLLIAPLKAQEQVEDLSAVPEATEAVPGFLRTDPANVDAEGNRIPSDFSGLTAKKIQRQLTDSICKSNYQDFVYYYPQGLGSILLDAEIERLVSQKLNRDVEERRKGGFCNQDLCGSASCGAWGTSRIFEIHRPSANYVSILFSDYSETGGAHPSTSYDGVTYNLATGQPMTLMELFPHPQQSVPKYWEMIYQRWCENAGYKFPLHYRKSEPCGQPDNQSNPNTFAWASTLTDLGRLVFTPYGASMVLGPYESGSNASGTVVMDFSRTEMLAIGASPAVWGQ